MPTLPEATSTSVLVRAHEAKSCTRLRICMRPTLAVLKQAASSSRWKARQHSDPFVRARIAPLNDEAIIYRSRAAFKLLDLSTKHPPVLGKGKFIVDLGAAPGGWTQVAVPAVGRGGMVWAVDILGMEGILGAEVIQGDFLDAGVHAALKESVRRRAMSNANADKDGTVREDGTNGLVDTVLSDMMAPMSGVRLKNIQASLDLVEAATNFAKQVLKPSVPKRFGAGGRRGGSLVLKHFAHPDLDAWRQSELDPYFARVLVEKPEASRKESSEAYWVCLGYRGTGTDTDTGP